MTKEKFSALWTKWSEEWYTHAVCDVEGEYFPVSKFCTIREGILDELLEHYNEAKENVKDIYFYHEDNRLNKFKRAAVLAYVISSATPLIYKKEEYEHCFGKKWSEQPDRLFLKQRLAFYIALGSIIMEYDEKKVAAAEKPIFRFPNLTDVEKKQNEGGHKVDDFLTSVYKDLFFAEMYHNRNVLTLANLFWALTENSSLRGIPPL